MIKRIVSLAAIVAALTVTATAAMTDGTKPFDANAFAMAKAEGKTVLLDFHADWCPVCRKQAEVLPQVLSREKFENVVVFKANYDSENELKQQLGINHQSTLVVFKGEKEVGREAGVTTVAAISQLLEKGL